MQHGISKCFYCTALLFQNNYVGLNNQCNDFLKKQFSAIYACGNGLWQRALTKSKRFKSKGVLVSESPLVNLFN